MNHPYINQSFIGFFLTLFQRIWAFCMGDLALEQLSSDELQILVLSFVSLSCALCGTFLVLRKMTMLANALSHTILPAIILTYLLIPGDFFNERNFSMLFFASLIAAALTTFLTQFLIKRFRISEDSSIGLVFTTLFAIGIVMATLFTKNVHIGLESVMGNTDLVHLDDLKLIAPLFFCNLLLITLFFKEYHLTSFDPSYSRVLGIRSQFFHYLLMLQTAATAICAFRVVGVILVLSFLVTPTLCARLVTHRLRPMLFFSGCFGVITSIVSVALSRHFLSFYDIALSTGALTVTMQMVFFFIFLLFKRRKRVVDRLQLPA